MEVMDVESSAQVVTELRVTRLYRLANGDRNPKRKRGKVVRNVPSLTLRVPIRTNNQLTRL